MWFFAMAKKKVVKAMHKVVRDLERFSSVLSPPTSKMWVANDLTVISESEVVAEVEDNGLLSGGGGGGGSRRARKGETTSDDGGR